MANCEMEDSHEAGSAPLTRVTNILTANDSSTESPHLSAIEVSSFLTIICSNTFYKGKFFLLSYRNVTLHTLLVGKNYQTGHKMKQTIH